MFEISSNFTGEMKEKVNFFYLRGAFKYQKLGFVDRMMMNVLRKKLLKKKPEELDEDSKGLLAAYENPIDWTDRKAIEPIVKCIKEQ